MKSAPLTLGCLTAFVLSCSSNPAPSNPPPPPPPGDTADAAAGDTPPAGAMTLEDVGLSTAALDRKADPCTDFYQFACGGWLESTSIPADRSTWSRGFSEIHERNQKELRSILEAAAKGGADQDPNTARLGMFYASCMDEPAIEKAGLSAIDHWLAQARKLRNKRDVSALVTGLQTLGINTLFWLVIDQDFKDPTLMITQLYQAGLGLPDRDYYLKDDDKMVAIRKAYTEHVQRMLELAGDKPKDAARGAADVLALETRLAKASKARVELRDPKGLDNRVERKGLVKMVPNFDWKGYFKGIGKPDWTQISISSPKFFAELDKVLKSTKPQVWRAYFVWHILDQTANMLPKAFVDENFAMAKVLTGQEKIEDRWKRCVRATDRAIPDLLGPAFVKARFGGDAKAAAESMVHGISDAFGRNLAKYQWMDEATRKLAGEKLAQMAYLIGYPNTWKNYDFEITADHYAQNVLAADYFDQAYDIAKLGKPIDREEWHMSAPTVNAYYNPSMNHMVFPAGILQPPFYDPKAGVAVNLGSMGMIVGHELTHGFDDQGSQFAGDGSLKNWWTPAVAKNFDGKKQCVIDQYAAYEAVPGLHLNGKLTLGENIADLGGVKLAFEAYRALRANATDKIVAGGFNEDQQYFLAVGQAWCTKVREEAARMRAQTDPHSPPKFRVNGSLSDLPAFSEAFQCAKGTPMNRQDMCTVW